MGNDIRPMTEREILQHKIDDKSLCQSDLLFGRKMPFGKYKDKYVYWVVVKHPHYATWVKKNTNFRFTETESWLHNECLDELNTGNLNRLIYDLSKQVQKLGYIPETNPHFVVE